MQESGFDLRVRNVEDFVSRTRVFPFTHVASGLALDAVLGGPGFEQEFLRMARPVDIGGLVVPVIGPEELVVTKILAVGPRIWKMRTQPHTRHKPKYRAW